MNRNRVNRNTRQEVKNDFGKPVFKDHDFNNLSEYYQFNDDSLDLIDEKTWNDLEMDKVFEFLDRTYSGTGEQYYYNLLHKEPSEHDYQRLIDKVNHYQSDFSKCINNAVLLKKYNSKTSRTLPSLLFTNRFTSLPKWVVFLSLISFLLFFSCFFLSKSFFVYFLLSAIINSFLHLYFRKRINTYHYDFINIKAFYSLYNKIVQSDNEEQALDLNEIKRLKKISLNCQYLTTNIEFADELSAAMHYVFELAKGIFLIDAVFFNRTLNLIKNDINIIRKVFRYVGSVDTAISITSVMQTSLGCEPHLTNSHFIKTVDAYHPLVDNCIPNSISLDLKNAIISGGNMSGKSTFLKVLGVNVLLSQTINFSFSSTMELPRLRVLSSIVSSDNLETGTSLFMSELLRAKSIINIVDSSDDKYFILFDELFKGTNSKDRISLGASMLYFLKSRNCFTIVTTHDIGIIELVMDWYSPYYFDHHTSNEKVIFDFKIKGGIQNESNVIELVKALKFPSSIIKHAEDYRFILYQ